VLSRWSGDVLRKACVLGHDEDIHEDAAVHAGETSPGEPGSAVQDDGKPTGTRCTSSVTRAAQNIFT